AFDYDFQIPADHMAGLYWYHPHLHPMVNREIAGGLSGGIVVGDILAPFPELHGITERVMLLKDLKIRHGVIVLDPDPSGPTLRTINGLLRPRIDIRPGELQFWRIANIGANVFYRLKLPRHLFAVIGQDGPNPLPLPTDLPPVADLRSLPLTRQRVVTFADGSADLPFHFLIDDRIYDHNRIDTTVALGDVEEWTVRNTSAELHVFHIHQTSLPVLQVDGAPPP